MQGFRPPFSVEAFMDVFARYNTAIWPMQIVAYALAVIAIIACVWQFRGSERLPGAILAFLWLWVGAAYHLLFFSAINPAARIFGVAFMLQGVFLIWSLIRGRLQFRFTLNSYGIVGSLFVIYAMIVYPLLGYAFGHVYPHAPMFGVTPCPLLVFTFGLFLFTTRRLPVVLFIIPSLWAIVGLSAAMALRVPQDFALIISAVVAIVMLAVRGRREEQVSAMLPREVEA